MAKTIDMIGKTFGKLTVIERAEDEVLSNGHKAVRYRCRCKCGNTTVVRGTALRSGKTTSCGCSRRTSMLGVNLEDLTGRRFGRWTVIGRAESLVDKRGHTVTMWHCRCDCGTERDIRAQSLKAGTTMSCGCYKANRLGRDLTGQRFGRWTVLGRGADKICSGRKLRTYSCVCDCGILRDVAENSLMTGKSTSCGCYRKERAEAAIEYEDLTGRRFGHWTVLEKRESRKYPGGGYAQMWFCRCDCGTVKEVSQCLLKGGYSRSCGCESAYQLEEDVAAYLSERGVHFERQKAFDDCLGVGGLPLRFDFYVEADGRKVLIECQGEQHYRPVSYFGGEAAFETRTEHDRKKREYAIANGYEFLEVPYTNRTREMVFACMDSFFKVQGA